MGEICVFNLGEDRVAGERDLAREWVCVSVEVEVKQRTDTHTHTH